MVASVNAPWPAILGEIDVRTCVVFYAVFLGGIDGLQPICAHGNLQRPVDAAYIYPPST